MSRLLSSCLVVCLAGLPLLAESQRSYSLRRVAGNGVAGYGGDGGPATEATLASPAGLAVDFQGNLYIADRDNHRVRMVDREGVIHTIAGTRVVGYSGDRGPASEAQLSSPQAVAVDGFGSVYIADSGNQRIRKIDPSGTITTLVGDGTAGYGGDGGQADQAQLNWPSALALDDRGVLLIADTGNHRIRTVGPEGMIATLAGNGIVGYSGDGRQAQDAQLQSPRGVVVDSLGNVYIADSGNHRIRKITPDGVITTIAGTGRAGYSGDGELAPGAQLNFPEALVADAEGSVFIADTGNQRVRQIDSQGLMITIVGGATFHSSSEVYEIARSTVSPLGIALNKEETLFFSDGVGQSVWTTRADGESTSSSLTQTSSDAGNRKLNSEQASGIVLQGPVQKMISTQERDALIALYNSTNGANWKNKTNWLGPAGTECTWFGITCSSSNGAVTGIRLSGNNLNGSIPQQMGNLVRLENLDFFDNQLTGALPSELSKMSELLFLNMALNQISGAIPPELSNLNNLRKLDVFENQLSGSIPPELGSLPQLQELYLGNNRLSGQIPSQLGNLRQLEVLYLGGNQLTGVIPAELGNLGKLQTLDLSLNQLSGPIPPQLGNLGELFRLGLGSNQLAGLIPSQLGNLIQLGHLDLAGNQLSGPIPPQLGNLSDLQTLFLSVNQLTGPIPPELGKLVRLYWLALGANQLSGPIPSQLGGLLQLEILFLSEGQLSGSVPSELGKLVQLQVLELANNRLSGPIPPQLGNLTQLQILTLSANQLRGAIPSQLSNLTALPAGSFDLSWNGLYTNDPTLQTFLKRVAGEWEITQTVAPGNVASKAVSSSSVEVSWTPIQYQFDTGGYRVLASGGGTGSYTPVGMTGNKQASSLTVTGLTPATSYSFVVETVTNPHAANQNTVTSEQSAVTSAATPGGAACSYTIQPTSQSIGADGDVGTVSVTAGEGCTWTAVSQAPWITVTAGASGNGNGTVNYTVEANLSTTGRPGTIVIAGQTLTVTQAGVTCLYTVTPGSVSVEGGGGDGTLTVSVAGGCNWTAVSNVGWIRVSPASGSGNGSVSYTVDANLGSETRTGTLTVARQTVTVTQGGAATTGESVTLFVPVVLSIEGQNNSYFTSELTLTNRGSQAARLELSFGAGGGKGADTLGAGRQKIVPDAIAYLKSLGVAIPDGGPVGTLRVSFTGLSTAGDGGATVRTTTAVEGGRGRAGLAYGGTPVGRALRESSYVFGLRQTEKDRSNVAVQHAGTAEEGELVLRLTVTNGNAANPVRQVLPEVRLAPGEFQQIGGILQTNGLNWENGYVKVERVSGSAPYYAYGVINDNANSDGSFVEPVLERELMSQTGLTVPVVVESSAFNTELVVTNASEESKSIELNFVADGVPIGNRTILNLNARSQVIITEGIVDYIRRREASGLGIRPGSNYAGALYIKAWQSRVASSNLSGVFIGARTSGAGGGGRYGLFYAAVPNGKAVQESAWLYGLQQNAENRTNLALVNTGEADTSDDVFSIELYDGDTGQRVNTVSGTTLKARGWMQLNTILGQYAPSIRHGYARITRTSGSNPFIAYSVINDGGGPGQRSGDGAFVSSAPP